jgi:hypothetical protein
VKLVSDFRIKRDTVALKEEFSRMIKIESPFAVWVNGRKDKNVKLAIIALASVFALSSTCALARTVRHGSHVRAYPIYRAAPSVVFYPSYRIPNGSPDGPTTLSGTGSSQFGGGAP